MEIDVPEGYVIDEVNSTFKTIVFKKKLDSYEEMMANIFEGNTIYRVDVKGDIQQFQCDETNYSAVANCKSVGQARKLLALNQLMNVATFINNGWKPEWGKNTERKWHLAIKGGKIVAEPGWESNGGVVYFSTKEDAMEAINVLGEKVIREVLTTDY